MVVISSSNYMGKVGSEKVYKINGLCMYSSYNGDTHLIPADKIYARYRIV